MKEKSHLPGTAALEANPDPFLPYQEIFSRLLPGKSLEPIDPKAPREFHYQIGDSKPMPVTTLSSGEFEVVKVAFDLVWKRLTHSVILVDEPELHLHPTLTFRLVETLKEFGGGTNQLILFTHSADLISTYYATGNVFFIDSSSGDSNQAHQLSALGSAHAAVARAASANLGLFAVGKRIIFVEGRESSVDRLVYHKVAQKSFPDSYLMPLGSVDNVVALRSVADELANAVFGIDLFLIRDRDGLSDEFIATLEGNSRFRCLPRRHIENYLLDEDVLAEVSAMFYLPPDRRDPQRIQQAMFDIASTCLMHAVLGNVRDRISVLGSFDQPRVRNLEKLSPAELVKSVSDQVASSLASIVKALDKAQIERLVLQEHAKLQSALADSAWIRHLPGKLIFARFCGEFMGVDAGRVREAYADVAMRSKPEVFGEISGILESFRSASASPRAG